MQKQLKRKGEFKRKKYKQDYLQKINKSKRGLKVRVTFNKISIKRFKLKKFKFIYALILEKKHLILNSK